MHSQHTNEINSVAMTIPAFGYFVSNGCAFPTRPPSPPVFAQARPKVHIIGVGKWAGHVSPYQHLGRALGMVEIFTCYTQLATNKLLQTSPDNHCYISA